MRNKTLLYIWLGVLILVVESFFGVWAFGEATTKPAEQPISQAELEQKTKVAVDRGLKWLSEQQAKDGSYGNDTYPVAVTSFVGLAFLNSGSTPISGPYSLNVKHCVDYVMSKKTPSGLLASGNNDQITYEFGYALLFLSECYGMYPNEELKDELVKAAKLLGRSQNEEGGFRYTLTSRDSDSSVVCLLTMVLRNLRNVGIKVEKSTIDRSLDYVKRCYNPTNGRFNYQINSPQSTVALSALCINALFYCGDSTNLMIPKAVQYITNEDLKGSGSGFWYYSKYYESLALYHASKEEYAKFRPKIIKEVLDKKVDDHWVQGEVSSDHYSTAMSLLILQLDDRLLPFYAGVGNSN